MRSARLPRLMVAVLAAAALCAAGVGATVAAANDVDSPAAYIVSSGYYQPVMAEPPDVHVAKSKKYRGWEGYGPLYHTSRTAKKTRKLWRGILNVALGWVEVPKEILVDSFMVDPFTGFFTGLRRGTGKTVDRALTGVGEIVFFWDESTPNFAPTIQPEFVLGEYPD